jgi:hypothetical protein
MATNPDYCSQFHWTGSTSEKRDPLFCNSNLGTSGCACSGDNCDNLNLACTPVPTGILLDYSTSSWSGPFSEEGAKDGRNSRICEGEGIVTGVECTGRYCDNLNLQCTKLVSGGRTNCAWSGSLSDEKGAYRFDHWIAGVMCTGRFCDNMKFLVCDLEVPPLEWAIDRPGLDYKNFDLPDADPELCRAACESEEHCKAWTHVHPGIQGPSARCWLKGAVPGPVGNSCCVSGLGHSE